MNPNAKTIKESVELLKLKAGRLIDSESLTLKEDIWGKGTLVLKSGAYLTEDIIRKLPNFGIEEIEAEEFEQEYEEVYVSEENEVEVRNFIRSQNVLIVEKNIFDASAIVKPMVDAGFKTGNIFVTREPSAINGYFRAKKFNFLFINQELYETAVKCVEKFSVLKNTHVFVISETDNVAALNLPKNSKIKFLYKEAGEDQIIANVLQALHNDFSELINEEEPEEEAMIS